MKRKTLHLLVSTKLKTPQRRARETTPHSVCSAIFLSVARQSVPFSQWLISLVALQEGNLIFSPIHTKTTFWDTLGLKRLLIDYHSVEYQILFSLLIIYYFATTNTTAASAATVQIWRKTERLEDCLKRRCWFCSCCSWRSNFSNAPPSCW
jgi:hypothetical protein